MKAKYELLNRSGVLAFEYDTAQFADLGGMARLKDWLKERRAAFDGSAPQLDAPKGMLLLGVQGCGKSVAAKCAAGIFGVSLLRLDFSAIHNKYVGESERNLRETLATAEVMAPCVLWIDEIEKGLATGDGDSGTSRRLLGSFLTWLAEKKQVFRRRHGKRHHRPAPRAHPQGTVRRDLLRRLARRAGTRGHPAHPCRTNAASTCLIDHFGPLAVACEGFSGAEIEQAIVSALYAAHARGEQITGQHVLTEVKATRPLSVVMAERIAELREWAADRTVSAD